MATKEIFGENRSNKMVRFCFIFALSIILITTIIICYAFSYKTWNFELQHSVVGIQFHEYANKKHIVPGTGDQSLVMDGNQSVIDQLQNITLNPETDRRIDNACMVSTCSCDFYESTGIIKPQEHL